jgi:hypothetical protein
MKNLLTLTLIGIYVLGGVASFDLHKICSEKVSVLKDDTEITQLIKEQSLKDKKLQDILEETGASKTELSGELLKCTEVLMKKGFFKVGHTFIDEILEPLGIESGDIIKKVGNQIKKDIDVLAVSSRRSIQETIPVFQWGQSNTSILIQVKFAHRFDSPGCINIRDEVVRIENKNVYLSAYCVQANNPIKFVLNISLFDEIIADKSTWKMESVGRMSMELPKKDEKIWIRLLETTEKMNQMQIWWDLKEEHAEAMDAYSKLLDEMEEQKIADKEKKKPKKTKKSKKKKDDFGMDTLDEL